MPVDKKIVIRKITLIREDLPELEKIGKMKLKEFIKDNFEEILAERYLERIIGRMIDINYHILTESGNPSPLDYYHSFTDLGKANIITDGSAKKMAQFAGLRNVLAHEYDFIDKKKVWQGMKSLLKLLPSYLSGIGEFLKGKAK